MLNKLYDMGILGAFARLHSGPSLPNSAYVLSRHRCQAFRHREQGHRLVHRPKTVGRGSNEVEDGRDRLGCPSISPSRGLSARNADWDRPYGRSSRDISALGPLP
jgi:hypothetical protein